MGFNEIKKIIFDLAPDKIKRIYQEPVFEELKKFNSCSTLSFSQEGEDLILKRIFEDKKKGFYVDIGAHHPLRFSNTYLFYKMGWRGINIDATPGSMKEFNKMRRRDINLEVGISNIEQETKFYAFQESALNTFDVVQAEKWSKKSSLIGVHLISTLRLETILDNYLEPSQKIDFLTVDAEGLDELILRSNNWKKYKPSIVLVESLKMDIRKLLKSDINFYMEELGYKLFSKTCNTSIYRIKDEL